MKEFKPISCCNTTYKVIAKILISRLKPLLPNLVNKNQSAFIRGRQIQDNILLMHEMVKNYKRVGGPKDCAIKVDIMKAFDMVKWDYLTLLLKKMGFPEKYVNWIWLCVSRPFSINLNGSLVGNFKSSRGIRQGDPLSPCLFVLIMESFTQILKSKIMGSSFKYHSKCKYLDLSSLAFADDLFILSKAESTSLLVVKEALMAFQSLSGLQPNLAKCEIFFSGVSPQSRISLSNTLGMKQGTLPIRYLGVPLISGQLSFSHCGPLIDRLNARV